jgi:hypothetical protein
LDPITNSGPNLPIDHDLDDPIAYFRLFFTNDLIQYLVDCTNQQAERERERGDEGSARPWKPILQIDMDTYLGSVLNLFLDVVQILLISQQSLLQ